MMMTMMMMMMIIIIIIIIIGAWLRRVVNFICSYSVGKHQLKFLS